MPFRLFDGVLIILIFGSFAVAGLDHYGFWDEVDTRSQLGAQGVREASTEMPATSAAPKTPESSSSQEPASMHEAQPASDPEPTDVGEPAPTELPSEVAAATDASSEDGLGPLLDEGSGLAAGSVAAAGPTADGEAPDQALPSAEFVTGGPTLETVTNDPAEESPLEDAAATERSPAELPSEVEAAAHAESGDGVEPIPDGGSGLAAGSMTAAGPTAEEKAPDQALPSVESVTGAPALETVANDPAEEPPLEDAAAETSYGDLEATAGSGGAAHGEAPESASSGFFAQFASSSNQSAAEAAADELAQNYADALEGKSVELVEAEVDGNTMYRLRAGPFPSRAAAGEVCAEVFQLGGECLPVRGEGLPAAPGVAGAPTATPPAPALRRATVREPAPAQTFRTTTRLNFRAGPGENAPRLGTLAEGAAVERLSESSGWALIALGDGRTAYVLDRYLRPVAPGVAGAPTATPPAPALRRATVREPAPAQTFRTTTRLNFRAGPGENAPRLGTLAEGAAVERLSESSGWALIALDDGRTAYVLDRYLRPVAPTTNAAAEASY